MAGIIKKQILKHLSKFAKNLSADSINLSTLKGEGELNNLELDCIAIQNLIDLPTWLQINHAKCNRVHVKIPWTKLKNTAITIFLDCVDMEMVTCEKPRPPNGPSPIEASASNGDNSYGFIEKVLEGITVRINSINVNFTSAVFKAEFQLSQLSVCSTDPEGKRTDLRFTRIINSTLGQVLTFKKVTWQTMRVVIDAASLTTGAVNTPIRLITNHATVDIILRRKMSNLSVLASKLHLKFDDLLWVLSDAQVQSALLCVKSIRETIERSRKQGRSRSESLSRQNISPPVTPQHSESTAGSSTDPFFLRHMIHETSYHCDVGRVDLHICDDGSNPNKEAEYKKVAECGAILITLSGLKMDHYPYHKAGKNRSYFRDYNDISSSRDKWAEEIIDQFRKDFVQLKKAATAAHSQGQKQSATKLLESCMVFRLADMEIGQVTSVGGKDSLNAKVLSSRRKELHLPEDMPLYTAFITDYYYPDGRDYPAPHNNIFMKLNAPQFHAHWTSLMWINQLAMATIKSVQEMLEDFGVAIGLKDPREEDHVDIRIEVLMPKIFIPLLHPSTDENLPQGIEINVSQATVTNCRQGQNSSRDSLGSSLQKVKESYLVNNLTFPHDKGHDYDVMHHMFEDHVADRDSPLHEAVEQAEMKRTSLIGKAYKDVWSVWVRQIWLDFITKETVSGSKPKSFPFIDSTPLMLWISKTEAAIPPFAPVPIPPIKTESLPCTPSSLSCDLRKTQSEQVFPSPSDESMETCDSTTHDKDRFERNKKLLDFYRQSVEKDEEAVRKVRKPIDGSAAKYILIDSEKAISLMVDHYQFLFLLRLMDSIGHVGEKVLSDIATIFSTMPSNTTGDIDTDSTGVRMFLPLVNLFLILRPSTATQSSVSDPANQILPAMISKEVERSDLIPRFNPGSLTPSSVRSVSPSGSSTPDSVSVLGDDVTSLSFIPPIGGVPTMIPARKGRPDLPDNDRISLSSSPIRSKRGSDPAAQLRNKAEDRLMSQLTSLKGNAPHDIASNKSAPLSSGYRTDSYDSLSTNTTMTSQDDNESQSSGSLDHFVVLEMDPPPIEEVIVPSKFPKSSLSSQRDSLNGRLSQEPPSDSASKYRSMSDPQPTHRSDEAIPTLNVSDTAIDKRQVSLFKITAEGAVELAVDSYDGDSSIRIVAPQVSAKQLGDMSLDSAVSKFLQAGTVSSSSSAPSSPRGVPPSVRMRIDSGGCATRFYDGCDSHMQIEVNGFKETLQSSSLANLGAFLEDEKDPEIVPMKINVYDVTLTIESDEDPVYPNSVRVPPVQLNVHEAHVRRDNLGVFHVTTESIVAPDLLKTLHFSSGQDIDTPTFSSNQNSVSDAQSTSDTKAVADPDAEVTSLRLKLEEMTRERDSLVFALDRLQNELNLSETERSEIKSMLEKQSNPYDVKISS